MVAIQMQHGSVVVAAVVRLSLAEAQTLAETAATVFIYLISQRGTAALSAAEEARVSRLRGRQPLATAVAVVAVLAAIILLALLELTGPEAAVAAVALVIRLVGAAEMAA